jgi:DNA-binding response OmpR family regulator
MDLTRHTVNRDGIALELTMREFDILQYLIVNRERIVSREMLMRDIWKANLRYTSLDNLIDVQMVRLRRKVDGPFETRLLQTVRGMGYMLQEKK